MTKSTKDDKVNKGWQSQQVKTTYIIFIDFFDYLFQANIFNAKLITSLLKFFLSNIPTSIFIKVRKGCKQMIFSFDLVKMQCCRNELTIINRPTIIYISLQFQGIVIC